jgi:hypothetical protein
MMRSKCRVHQCLSRAECKRANSFNFKFHYLFLFPVFSFYFSFSISVQLIKHVSLLLLLHLETDCDEVFQGKFDGVNLRKYLIDCKYLLSKLFCFIS